MTILKIEFDGNDSAAIDSAVSELLDSLTTIDAVVQPTQSDGTRDGGVIALTIAVLGGLASLAQIAAFIHSILQKKDSDQKNVTIILIGSKGKRHPIANINSKEEINKLLLDAAEDRES